MKNKFWISSILTAVLVFSSHTGFAQDTPVDLQSKDPSKVRPVRIGVKLGFPNIIGGNLEYVTPLLGKKLAVNADYSTIKSGWFLQTENEEEGSNTQINYTYLDLGLNYYFFRRGYGLYGGISYNTIKVESVMDYTDSVEYMEQKHNSFNVKLGAKLGGLFYFRPEVGYSFDPLPKEYEVLVIYNDGTRETRTGSWSDSEGPGNLLFEGLLANIGLGFAF